jgi:hypothetical protein
MKTIIGPFKFSMYIILVAILSACSSYLNEAFKGYVGEIQSIEELSTIRMDGSVDWLKVGGHIIIHKEFGEIVLLPGVHEIEWGTSFVVSFLFKSSGSDKRTWTGSITLLPGQTYTIYADRTLGVGYVVYSWVEDRSGEKVEIQAKQMSIN